jgi:tetratricopeptide (TPR) repeat protein
MEVECLDWEANALALQEDSGALAVREEALRRCRQLRPVPDDLLARLLTRLANLHARKHDWEKVVACSVEAAQAAENVLDLGRVARISNDLSIAYQALGRLHEAAACAQRALSIHAMEGDRASMARAGNNLGLALMRQGRLDEGEIQIQRAADLSIEIKLEKGQAHVQLSLAELHLIRGRLDAARAALATARGLAEKHGERTAVATCEELAGVCAELAGEPGESDECFQRALGILGGMDEASRLAECHAAYATLLEARGDVAAANRHWRDAAVRVSPSLAFVGYSAALTGAGVARGSSAAGD